MVPVALLTAECPATIMAPIQWKLRTNLLNGGRRQSCSCLQERETGFVAEVVFELGWERQIESQWGKVLVEWRASWRKGWESRRCVWGEIRVHVEASWGMSGAGFPSLSIDILLSILCCGTALCNVGCLALCLAAICWCQKHHPPPGVTSKNVFRYQVSPRDQNCPWFGATVLVGTVIHTAGKVLGYVLAPSARKSEDPVPSLSLHQMFTECLPHARDHMVHADKILERESNMGPFSWRLECPFTREFDDQG